jgi:glycosyltransferase involved in cell wall biosynthesis
MRFLFISGRELDYVRNDVVLRAFHRLGTVQVIGETQPGPMLSRITRVFFQALPYLLFHHYDLIFVGFYGHLLMLPVGILSHSPVLFDAFVSTYDTLCFDRQRCKPSSLLGRLAFWLDQTSCRLADSILLDTQCHVDYFIHTFDLLTDKVKYLPVGCNEDIFYPRPQVKRGNLTSVLFYSSYLPLHGVGIAVRAAGLLRSEQAIRFRLIGTGQEYPKVHKLADDLGLENITFLPPVSLETLANEIASADICLGGHFGRSDKSRRVIPSKIYQILSMGRPLIAADTPANRELLSDGLNACFCPQDNPEALADAILKLHYDKALREQLSYQAHSLYSEKCSEIVITGHLQKIVERMI